MYIPGEKAKEVDLWDNLLETDRGLVSVYKIEVMLCKSPKQGVKCGAVIIFKNNSVDLQVNPALVDQKKLQELRQNLDEQTEVMYKKPIKFRETDGQWLDWAMKKALALYDEVGGAPITIKAPELYIYQSRSSSAVASGRSNLLELFPCLKVIDKLFDGEYKYDPWTKTIRRGRINAKMGNR